ncbi:hypothetical protein L0F63_001815 [Massospora cicadina]|nr:hypothetical protein L0F63_001815 [Massospora cicadina]
MFNLDLDARPYLYEEPAYGDPFAYDLSAPGLFLPASPAAPNLAFKLGRCQEAIGLFPVEFCRPADEHEIQANDHEPSTEMALSVPLESEQGGLHLTTSSAPQPPLNDQGILLNSLGLETDALKSWGFEVEAESLDSMNNLYAKPQTNRRRLPSLALPTNNRLSSALDLGNDLESGSSVFSLAESSVLKDDLSSLHISYAQFNQLYLGDDEPESLFEVPREAPLMEVADSPRPEQISSSSSDHSQAGPDSALALSPMEPPSPDAPQQGEVHPAAACFLDVQLEGALSIKSEWCESGVLTSTKHWKQFWVVVQAGALLVYKDPKSKKFKGWYDLVGATVAPAVKGQSKKRHVFSLTSGSRLPPALFQASDATSCHTWLTQLKPRKPKMIGKLFSRPIPKPTSDDSVWGTLAGDSDHVAYVVKRCVEELVTRESLKQVGLYRLSGNNASIRAWKDKFITLGPVSLASEPDTNVITGILKLYFRELVEPLIPYPAYEAILEAARISQYDDRLMRIKDILHEMLSDLSFSTLQFLIHHLAAICDYSDINKMDANNLAIVFGPTLARPQDAQLHPQLQPLYMLVESLILQENWFFDLD